ncbi:DUF4400 domain-containing protein [Vibrio sp. 10N]|uniref:DUF4400 domain-containing protein n=1 Tax=Vibrio sp. 10N TaxID=3058938 RepID=UPI0028144642|nr:hypothetical protein VB10N_46770 [Vibrio sp. 10N]
MAEQTVTRKPLWFLMIIIATQIAVVASLSSRELIVESFETEIGYMQDIYGEAATDDIVGRSLSFSQTVYINSGALELTKSVLLPVDYLDGTLAKSDALYSLWQVVDDIAGNIYIAIAYTTMRVLSFAHWLPLVALLGIPAVLTGYLQREIKKESFEYSSPLRFGLSQKMLYMLPIIVYSVFVFPFSISPLVMVVLVVVFSACVSVLISNAIKRV